MDLLKSGFLCLMSLFIAQLAVAQSSQSVTISNPSNSRPVRLEFPRESISANELGVIINTADPQSVAVGNAYKATRNVPSGNMIYVNIPSTTDISQSAAIALRSKIYSLTPTHVQAYAITWLAPSRVVFPRKTDVVNGFSKSGSAYQSITSAIMFGVDAAYTNYHPIYGCRTSKANTYYASSSTSPYLDLKVRPTMMIAGWTEAEALKLIERGAMADGRFPSGDGYYIRTTDKLRSVRYSDFNSTVSIWNRTDRLKLNYIDNSTGTGSNYISNKTNVLVYQTGLASVSSISTNKYIPGAVADHLTSYGGRITAPGSSGQMSLLRWLEAGATGSYGTVQEPCNYVDKFPTANTFLEKYFQGATLVEAYSKSVRMPGEGLFVGEPLAKPFGTNIKIVGGTVYVTTSAMKPKASYVIEAKNSTDTSYRALKSLSITDARKVESNLGTYIYDNYRLREGTATLPVDTPPPSNPTPTPVVSKVFKPSADASVFAASPTQNFGRSLTLESDLQPVTYAYLKFTVTNLTAAPKSAKIRMYVVNSTPDAPKLVQTSSSWSETAVTFNNRPAPIGGTVSDLGSVRLNTWVEYDVSTVVKGDGTFSFSLVPVSTDGIDLSSRESSRSPELVLGF